MNRVVVLLRLVLCVSAVATIAPAAALGQQPLPYGSPIKLEAARKVIAAAEAKAKKEGWSVVIAVVDTGGHIVQLTRLDDTQFGSVEVARQKAYSAAAFRRSTKVFQDLVAAGGEGLRILKLEGAVPLEGGLPIVVDGKIVGASGVSGVTAQQDGQIAQAGIDALAKEKAD